MESSVSGMPVTLVLLQRKREKSQQDPSSLDPDVLRQIYDIRLYKFELSVYHTRKVKPLVDIVHARQERKRIEIDEKIDASSRMMEMLGNEIEESCKQEEGLINALGHAFGSLPRPAKTSDNSVPFPELKKAFERFNLSLDRYVQGRVKREARSNL